MINARHGNFTRQRLIGKQQQRKTIRTARNSQTQRTGAFFLGPKKSEPLRKARDQIGIEFREGSRPINQRLPAA